jgi:peroxiredoxin Q/BCP
MGEAAGMSENAVSSGKVGLGDKAPDFTLPGQSGLPVRLYDLLGQRAVVLFFYPKDNTSGCTAEVCAFRDSYEVFKEAGADVVGVSSDSVKSHAGFAVKHRLPFTLLSDKGGAVRKLYGVPATLGVLPGRVTYILDRDGVVRHMFSSQMAISKHVSEALRVLESLQAQDPAPPVDDQP